MDWKLFLSTFGVVFLAELGDKTQLAALSLTADSKKPLIIFLAASLALILATLLGVLIGDALFRVLPQIWIQRGAAVLFVIMGVLLWLKVI